MVPLWLPCNHDGYLEFLGLESEKGISSLTLLYRYLMKIEFWFDVIPYVSILFRALE